MLRLISWIGRFFQFQKPPATLLLLLCLLLPGVHLHLNAQDPSTAQTEEQFLTAVKKGDQYYAEEKYDRALYEYETARKIKPDEKYPQERIRLINEILDDQKTKNILFEVAITSAEQWYRATDYKRAKAEYENALRIDPTAQYPKDRLAQINKIWSDPAVDAAYAATILLADDLFAQKRYRDAKAEYLKASDLKPFEQYPLDRIIAINEILAQLQQQQDQYDGLITKADGFFNDRKYQDAKSTYQDASNIKPDEVYPKNRIKEIEELLARLQAEREAYEMIIALADEYYIAKDFEKAKVEYQKAAEMKPLDNYPKSMLAKIDPLIAQMQQIQQEYDLTVTNAHNLLQQKDYEGALALYEKAGTIKPLESLPKDKIAEINGLLDEIADLKEKEARYLKTVQKADSLLAMGDLEPAREEFNRAAEIMPGEGYPKNQIAEIDRLLTEKSAQTAYDQAIATADQQLKDNNYQAALENYRKALAILPSETYPTTKINEINGILADMQAMEDAYLLAIGEGDEKLSAGEYENARTAFQQALSLKPGEAYPQSKLDEIERILEEINRIQQEYEEAIASADKYFAKPDYLNARSEYAVASALKPLEIYPKDKISEIDRLLADREAMETAYNNAIALGDEYFASEDWAAAKNSYQEALTLKPEEKYPSDQVKEIDRIMAELKAKDEEYNTIIAAADAHFTDSDYTRARSEYQAASDLKPEEQYPKDRISQIDRVLQEKQALEDAYAGYISSGDESLEKKEYQNAMAAFRNALELKPDESYPQNKITQIEGILADLAAQDQEYQQAVATADNLLAANDYPAAIIEYQKALRIKPDSPYPQNKIDEINQILAEQKEREETYHQAIADGNKSLAEKRNEEALAFFRKALEVKPGEKEPQDRISEINSLLMELRTMEAAYALAIQKADAEFSSKAYEDARNSYQNASQIKPSESYPKSRMEEIDRILAEIGRIQQEYDRAIASGDQLFANSQYTGAREEYVAASGLKPGEQYPIDRISEIDRILQEKQALEDAYAGFISTGDELLDNKDYQNALTAYKQASELKPGDSYPKNKIAQIEGILADLAAQDQEYQQAVSAADAFFAANDYLSANIEYQKALRIKPQETYPQDKINEINQILADLKAKDEAFEKAVDEGDKLLSARQYPDARDAFIRALEIKPEEEYPASKINEIDQILDQIRKEEDYRLAMEQGDRLTDEGQYQQAITAYQQALELKPGESEPQARIDRINELIASIQARQKAYDEAVASADALFSSGDYENAKQDYQKAAALDPEQSYPTGQIERIDEILRDQLLQKSFDETIARADRYFNEKDYDNARTEYQKALNLKQSEPYPQSRLNEISGIIAANEQARLESYNKAIEAGDAYYALQDYKNAKVQYQNAISLNPGQQYPKDRLKEVEDILLAREMELKQAYQQAVAKADNLYQQKILDEAIDAYQQAIEIKPDEIYPHNMIRQIKKYIEEHAIVDILQSSVIISNNTERKFDFTPVDIRMRKNNYIVMKARVLSETKPKVYLNYGVDAQRSGGIVLKSVKDNEMNDYIIRVSAQDPWYRNDNNWLKLYSEGGDIEVTYLQISTAD